MLGTYMTENEKRWTIPPWGEMSSNVSFSRRLRVRLGARRSIAVWLL